MKIVLSIIIAGMTAILSNICLRRELYYRGPVLLAGEPHDDENTLGTGMVWGLTAGIGMVAFSASQKILSPNSEPVNIIKMETALVCLAGSGCVDLREHRIPNIFPLIIATVGVFTLAAGLAVNLTGAVSYLVSSGLATAGTTIALLTVRALTKNGIGLGDVKLLAALALLGGVYTICGTLFFGVCTCAVASIVALVTHKKDIHGALPFGPFLFVGYILSIFSSLI